MPTKSLQCRNKTRIRKFAMFFVQIIALYFHGMQETVVSMKEENSLIKAVNQNLLQLQQNNKENK